MTKIMVQSLIVALVVGLVSPFVWIVTTGETKTTPVVERPIFDEMSEAQREEWIAENAKRAGFWEHLGSSASYVVRAWRGYLEAVAITFAFVFIANFAYLSYREKP